MSRKHGFTLTELLVVVAVIATLAAILLPVFAQVREKARLSTCLSNLHQLALAHALYVQEYDEVLPCWWVVPLNGGTIWTEYLRPYYRDAKILGQGFATAQQKQSSLWLADYVMLTWGPGGTGTLQNPYWRWPGTVLDESGVWRQMALAEVRRPSETLQWADGFTGPNGGYQLWAHGNQVLNGAYVDGHAAAISQQAWEQVDRDDLGFFYHTSAADR